MLEREVIWTREGRAGSVLTEADWLSSQIQGTSVLALDGSKSISVCNFSTAQVGKSHKDSQTD